MPKRTDLETLLIIGSGPIVIGQACEFDYSGTQACRVLRAEGYRVVLVNSNPATIIDRKSTRLNSSHTVIYTLSLHDALPIYRPSLRVRLLGNAGMPSAPRRGLPGGARELEPGDDHRSEERRVGKECRSLCDWSSDVCSSDLSAKPASSTTRERRHAECSAPRATGWCS